MLRSLLIISVLFGFTAYVWSTSVYECISIFSWDFCGSIGQAELIYPLFALDVFLALYLLSPFFTYFSYREIIKNRNKNKGSIEFLYNGSDQLNRLIEIIKKNY